MAGIVSYGGYVPIYRLGAESLSQVWGRAGRGERAVANWDEDSITMAVEAAMDCLNGMDRQAVDALYFASTTPPYKEKQSASIIAAALDLREDIVAADFADSLRSGTLAMKAALDAVKAGSARRVLVAVADCRLPAPNSAFEPLFGDGAAALLIGQDGVAAEVQSSSYLTSEFVDLWRLEGDRHLRSWEDRFILEEGYERHFKKAVSALLQKAGVTARDLARAAFYAPEARSHAAMARSLGLDPKAQVQDPLFDRLGNTGAAFAPMLLVRALEEAQPGERLLFASYGDGADAHLLQVTPQIEKLRDGRGVRRSLESKMMLDNYGKYLKFRGLMEWEASLEFRLRTSLPVLWRERQWVYRFHGHKCTKCGKTQFPMQKFCMYCQAPEKDLEEIRLAERKGTLLTFSLDERSPVIDPPNVLAAVALEGGGRFFSQMTDRDPKKLQVGMPMELTFRKIHDALGVHNYFWKCRPTRG